MMFDRKVEYVARDRQRQDIAWLRVTQPDGSVEEFENEEEPLTDAERASLPVRAMECVDCHSRPAHVFTSPIDSVNAALGTETLPSGIPYLKEAAVRALDGDYETLDAAMQGIEKSLIEFYEEEHPEELDGALRARATPVRRSLQSHAPPGPDCARQFLAHRGDERGAAGSCDAWRRRSPDPPRRPGGPPGKSAGSRCKRSPRPATRPRQGRLRSPSDKNGRMLRISRYNPRWEAPSAVSAPRRGPSPDADPPRLLAPSPASSQSGSMRASRNAAAGPACVVDSVSAPRRTCLTGPPAAGPRARARRPARCLPAASRSSSGRRRPGPA